MKDNPKHKSSKKKRKPIIHASQKSVDGMREQTMKYMLQRWKLSHQKK